MEHYFHPLIQAYISLNFPCSQLLTRIADLKIWGRSVLSRAILITTFLNICDYWLLFFEVEIFLRDTTILNRLFHQILWWDFLLSTFEFNFNWCLAGTWNRSHLTILVIQYPLRVDCLLPTMVLSMFGTIFRQVCHLFEGLEGLVRLGFLIQGFCLLEFARFIHLSFLVAFQHERMDTVLDALFVVIRLAFLRPAWSSFCQFIFLLVHLLFINDISLLRWLPGGILALLVLVDVFLHSLGLGHGQIDFSNGLLDVIIRRWVIVGEIYWSSLFQGAFGKTWCVGGRPLCMEVIFWGHFLFTYFRLAYVSDFMGSGILVLFYFSLRCDSSNPKVVFLCVRSRSVFAPYINHDWRADVF